MPNETQPYIDKARVTLYQIPNLLDENNFIVENWTNFLDQFSGNKYGPVEIQYQRLEDNKRLKLDLPQINAALPQYNYALIERGTWRINPRPSRYHYAKLGLYFIVGIRQLAPNTIELDLKLDVLNNFFLDYKDNFTEATFIARSHLDRFTIANKNDESEVLDLCGSYDRTSENDTPKLVRDTSESRTIYDARGGDTSLAPLKFYMIYRTSEGADPRPVIDIAANRQLKIEEGTSGQDYEINLGDLVDGRYYYLIGDLAFSIYSAYGPTAGSRTLSFSGKGMLIFYKVSTGIPSKPSAFMVSFISDNDNFATEANGTYIDAFVIAASQQYAVTVGPLTITKGEKIYYSNNLIVNEDAIKEMPSVFINAGTIAPKYLGDISELDRTKSNILKVIECPYCPISYSLSSNLYSFDRVSFPNDSEENPPFLRSFNVGQQLAEQTIRTISMASDTMVQVPYAKLKRDEEPYLEDPKLKTSPYYSLTFVYDSFSMDVKLEDYKRAEPLADGTFTFAIKYKQSSNISSDLAFSVKEGGGLGYSLYKTGENYTQIMAASRNNELPLFSSEYLNYIRNGYNYDKKKMADSTAFGGAMAGLQLVASILSFALSGVTGGVSAAAGVGLASGAIGSMANLAYSSSKSNEDLVQKINLLKSQSFKVTSIDNIDLFNWYGGNKLQLHVYKLEDNAKKEIGARFHYRGYAIRKYGTPSDYLYSRKYFNYIECDPVFKDGTLVSYSEYIEQICEKFRAGVTLFHPSGYDLDRWKENIEQSIIEALPEEEPEEVEE